LNKGDSERLEAAQMKFFRPLMIFTKLDQQRSTDIKENCKFKMQRTK